MCKLIPLFNTQISLHEAVPKHTGAPFGDGPFRRHHLLLFIVSDSEHALQHLHPHPHLQLKPSQMALAGTITAGVIIPGAPTTGVDDTEVTG